MTAATVKETIQSADFKAKLQEIYIDPDLIPYQVERLSEALDRFVERYGDGDLEVFSAPGRSEIGGNHTDHQQGKVLACALNLDMIAIVKKRTDKLVRLKSKGYNEIEVNLNTLQPLSRETSHSPSLVRGLAASLHEKGYTVGGFDAYTTSDVFPGSGMSSSAAFEILVGTIFSHLYNDGKISAVEMAKSAQYAENVFFGKPSGLLDQMACSVGALVNIDFANKENPTVKKVEKNFLDFGYNLCITNTKGSHADLTEDYAAVPEEMKQVASFFGKELLIGVEEAELKEHLGELRKKVGDRAVLRALHWFAENKRVDAQVKALEEGRFADFLKEITASGNSSFQYLQNVYTTKKPQEQGLSLALAVSEEVLGGKGACRVHGGGFAGTIQAFVPTELAEEYKTAMDRVFGPGSCRSLRVRKYGGIKLL